MPLFPEREKARGPALCREPCIDDRLSLPRALTKEKMPAEWLLSFKLGSLKILLALEIKLVNQIPPVVGNFLCVPGIHFDA